jgi:hypothetical protein
MHEREQNGETRSEELRVGGRQMRDGRAGETPASKLAAPKVGRNAGVRSALRLGSWGVLGSWG